MVHIMICRLTGAEPLSEPMLGYCLLYAQEQTSVKSWWNSWQWQWQWQWQWKKEKAIAKQHWSHIQTHMKMQVQEITSHKRKMITWQRGLKAKAYVPQYLWGRWIILTGCRTNCARCIHYPIHYWCITRFRIIVQRVFIDNGGKLICQFFVCPR